MGDDEEGPFSFELGDELDLHSFRPAEIAELVRDWLDDRCAAGSRSLRVIHGKGIGVQRERVRQILAADPRVIKIANAPSEAGGWGATVIDIEPDR